MRNRGSWFTVGALALVVSLLGGCGGFAESQRTLRFAALHPEDDTAGTAADYRGLHIRVEKPRPVRSLLEMRRNRVVIQKFDLSCGAAALGTLLNYEFGDPVTEKEIARGLISRAEYIENPNLLRVREGFSLLDLKRYVQERGYKGVGLGKLDFSDLVKEAPIMVPINANGYNHFVIFRGVYGNRVMLADPAWGNRTTTIEKFERMWLDYGEAMGHVGFVVEHADGGKPLSKLRPSPDEFVALK